MHHFEREPALSEGCDDQPPSSQRRVGLRMADATEGDEEIEIEVRAAAGTLHDVVDIQAAADLLPNSLDRWGREFEARPIFCGRPHAQR
jgi:hypothetical protein